MVTHMALVRRRPDSTLTTTVCGRMNKQSRDGMNSTDKVEAVTCKFCIAAVKRSVKP